MPQASARQLHLAATVDLNEGRLTRLQPTLTGCGVQRGRASCPPPLPLTSLCKQRVY